jgi:mannosyl-oligosaccharide alpha-1,2-mannosidase
MDEVLAASTGKGLAPIYLTYDPPTRFVPSKITFGAMGDSYYEYLLKQWLQTGKKEHKFKDQWILAMNEMHDKMVKKTAGGDVYIAELSWTGEISKRMDHLACFVGGMLELGYRTIPKEEVQERWHETAVGLTKTCHQMYTMTPSGLSPEYAVFSGKHPSVPSDAPHYLLRPEAAESIYYLWFFTGDPIYRTMAKDLFDGIVQSCKVQFGFSAVRDVRKRPDQIQYSDSMESFFLAETMKYLYLTFAPRDTLDLHKIVFNTEAHPVYVWNKDD